jgi:general secretion pathway protein E
MPVDEELRNLIIERASVDRLREHRRKKSLRTMWNHGLELVAEGKTTFEEILRVTRS